MLVHNVQLRNETAAFQEEALACMNKAEVIRERLEHLRSALPPVAASEASTPAACAGTNFPGCADIEERARAYASSTANLPKQVSSPWRFQ